MKMRSLKNFMPLSIGAMLILAACQKEVLPTTALPPISFNEKVMPIIASGCTAAGCHGQDNPESFSLLTYDEVIRHGGVVAQSPSRSRLYTIIKTPTSAVMPPAPNPPLTDGQIALVYLWILQGAKNN
jgi:hypothetical protein